MNAKQIYVFREPTLEGYQQEAIDPANTVPSPIAFPDIMIPFNQLVLQTAF